MIRRLLLLICLPLILNIPISAQNSDTAPHITVIAEGLFNPVGMALLPNGNLLIAEEGTGEDDLSAGVSMLLPDGTLGRLISEFPSGRDSGDLSGVPLVSVSPDGETIYVGNFNAMHLWTLPASMAETLPETPFTPDDLGVAMERLNNVFLSNPFDMTYDADGVPVVSDATNNGIAKELANGTTQFIHRFDYLRDPNDESVRIQAVPTGITRVDDEYYVTLLGGCPYPADSGLVVAVDENRNQRTVIDGLNLPIDVARANDGGLWVLEFARFTPDASCFSGMGYRSETGQLSYFDNAQLTPVLENLDFPGAVLPMPDGSLYITQIFRGQILHVTFEEDVSDEIIGDESAQIPTITPTTPIYADIGDYDETLASIIQENRLVANPGQSILPPNPDLAALGQDLFFDPILSGDMNISCSTCHHPAFAMGDGRVLPLGTGGIGLSEARTYLDHITIGDDYRGREIGEISNPFVGELIPRNSPTIINSALLPIQFWDGRVESYALGQPVFTQDNEVNSLNLTDILAAQALFPVTSVAEMAGVTFGDESPQYIRQQIAQRLMDNDEYMSRFGTIFGIDTIQPVHIVTAIAAFEQELIFTQSPWDNYIAGNTSALSDDAKRGALLFYGALNSTVNCASCHSGNLFTDMQFYNLLVPQIGHGRGNGATGREDFGRANVTFDYRDQYTFRTAPLRNVSLGAPYFHSGAFNSLDAVILHHANIIDSAFSYDPASHLPSAYYSSTLPFSWDRQGHSVSSDLLNGMALSEQDVDDLVAFLEALTDPNATDLMHLIPANVPSGLPMDEVPAQTTALSQLPTVSTTIDDTVTQTTSSEWYFDNAAQEVGLHFRHGAFVTDIFEDPVAMMGGGLCWIDFDKDGWLDLYLVNSYAEDEISYWADNGGLPQNALYRNIEGMFIDVSASSSSNVAMRGNGCVVADFNNDSWDDIFITADGPNALLLNNADGTFREVAQTAGIDADEWNSAAAVADLNNDGWIDLFVGSYIDLDNPVPNPVGAFPQDYFGIPDRMYLSNGTNSDGVPTFTEITRDVGLLIDERTLGAIFSDFDADGDLDLYLANDGQPNRLYQHEDADNGYGFTWIDTYETSGVNDRGSGMGVAAGDWTGDGWMDLVVTNWERELNAIYRNQTSETEHMSFMYSTYRIGMTGFGNNMTGWGVHFADFDHDTDLDMMTVNGRVPITNPATDAEIIRLYGNRLVEGYAGQFREWTEQVGIEALGASIARGSAIADFDNDGDLDIAINSISGDVILLRNHVADGNWLMVDLGAVVAGTRVEVMLDTGVRLVREVYVGSSYLASEDPRLHFGLGPHEQAVQLLVTYPDGTLSTYDNVSINQIFVVE